MKILSPINKVDEVEKIIKAGADEIYCSVLSKKWGDKYSYMDSFNSSPPRCNLKNYYELRKVVDIAHGYDVPVFFTLNSHYYSKAQYSLLIEEIGNAINCNIDAFIMADIGILDTLNKMDNGMEIHLSIVGGAFNSKTLDFYSKKGISRVVLPKQLTIDEMKTISKKNKKIDLECFIITAGCPNAEAFCRFQHGVIETKHPHLSRLIINNPFLGKLGRCPEKKNIKKTLDFIQDHFFLAQRSACHQRYNFLPLDVKDISAPFQNKQKISTNLFKLSEFHKVNGCNACRLSEFERLRVHSIKTEDRTNSMTERLNNIAFLKKAIKYILNNKNNNELFVDYIKEQHLKVLGYECSKYCHNYLNN